MKNNNDGPCVFGVAVIISWLTLVTLIMLNHSKSIHEKLERNARNDQTIIALQRDINNKLVKGYYYKVKLDPLPGIKVEAKR